MRTCSVCKESKSTTLFYAGKKPRSRCKQCDNNATNAYRYAHGTKKRGTKECSISKAERDRKKVEELKPGYVAAKLHMRKRDLTPELLQLGRERLLTLRALRELKQVIKEKLKETHES